ncbi:EF-hand domain-containing protein [Wenyingzhuangia sp. IMCC45467]
MIAVAICLFVGMNAFSQEEKSKDKKKERPTPEKMFAKLDKNEDGKLVKEEVEENKRMKKGFDKMDTDADGGITLAEFKTFFEKAQKARKERSEGDRPRRDWGNDGGMNDGGYQGGGEE